MNALRNPLIIPIREGVESSLPEVLTSYTRANHLPAIRIVDGIHWGFRTPRSSLEAFVVKVTREEWQSVCDWHNAGLALEPSTAVRIYADTAPMNVSQTTPDGLVAIPAAATKSEWLLVVSSPVSTATEAFDWAITWMNARTPKLAETA
jgi:hypothetical protein